MRGDFDSFESAKLNNDRYHRAVPAGFLFCAPFLNNLGKYGVENGIARHISLMAK
jgi:hypothetical protein